MTTKKRRPQAVRNKQRSKSSRTGPSLFARAKHAFNTIYWQRIQAAYRLDPKRFWVIFSCLLVVGLLFNWPDSAPDSSNDGSMRTIVIQPGSGTDSSPATITETTDSSTERENSPSELNDEAAENNPIGTPPVEAAPDSWQRFSVEDGDNLSKLFYRANLSDRDVYLFTNQGGEINQFTDLNVGQELWFDIQDGHVMQVKLIYDQLNYLMATVSPTDTESYDVELVTLQPDIRYESASATISNSLFLAATRVGISDRLTMELANIFGWDIDFALDIRENDQFKVVYEKLYLDGEFIGDGDIVAASFDNRGRHLQAVRYTDTNGDTAYHAPDGRSMRKAFLRTPVDFRRISSHFNLNRRHPILHTIRAHKGVDYAADRGTPIRSAGDGRVSFAGVKGGWGNVIIIQHGETYKTLYAHQSRFARGIREGSRVRQGQVIGYVGSSGLASGPHLHYEFYVNGVVRNPVTVDLPEAEPIGADEFERFRLQTAGLLALLQDGAAVEQQVAVAP
ncbi:peptidoglycan DD-metalloendopeptidase family protein [Umboniibacter marinipuniceus]|uniref:Murein DD-endopeptidase MepM/ murein hydrolase activator NlpD n=1 Tax=Umboniibacter marinipuniceus TaxID=569599 RepID=A0A3M0ACR4_9GAMM|nr:peptidoglycan DD-metalloendopeptidase family protein [Umboniibacter marinipuniceus]RMA82750.1 murein DD-endopeptidase MepM/ murein hydrolase activator NlpD [Umboniibacter marinipuniceus]